MPQLNAKKAPSIRSLPRAPVLIVSLASTALRKEYRIHLLIARRESSALPRQGIPLSIALLERTTMKQMRKRHPIASSVSLGGTAQDRH